MRALRSSRLPVGSSASIRRGRFISARATATRWRSPPESSRERAGALGEAHVLERSPRARSRAAAALPGASMAGITRFSSAVKSLSRKWNWKMKPTSRLR